VLFVWQSTSVLKMRRAYNETGVALPLMPSLMYFVYQKPKVFYNISSELIFLRRGVASTTLNPQAGRPLLVVCLQLLIQYIRSHTTYPGAGIA
jgi:hypothetical protein